MKVLRSTLALLLVLCSTGCVGSYTRELVPPQTPHRPDPRSPFLKVHLRDGGLCVLEAWAVDDTARRVQGHGDRFDPNRQVIASGPLGVPLDSVVLFETNVRRTHPSVAALAMVTGASLIATVTCLAVPKACFGSCPTFYVEEGGVPLLEAEGFSSSVTPALEATDVDALARTRPGARRFELLMRNEAFETHVVRRVTLLAAPRPEGGAVFATRDGRLWQARSVSAPAAARGAEGDCRAGIAALDGRERTSLADSLDLGARESVELEFPERPARSGLVLGARQSLMTTWLFYQTLSWLGGSAGDFIAALERRRVRFQAHEGWIGRLLGGIEVSVFERGDWRRVGELGETGPLATDVQMLPLPAGPPGPLRVRLRMAQGMWRLDWVALAALGDEVEPVRLEPVEVLHEAESGEAPPRDPSGALVTTTGDRCRFVFELPPDYGSRALFLESRGYYLEWMRDEWLAEEDPSRALRLFLRPRAALRELAPAFKRDEPGMEAAFWGSRHAHP